MKMKMHRILAVLLAVMMLIGMLPTGVLAVESNEEDASQQSEFVEALELSGTIGSLALKNGDNFVYITKLEETSGSAEDLDAKFLIEYQIPPNALRDSAGKLIYKWHFTRGDLQLSDWEGMNATGSVISGEEYAGTYEISGNDFLITFDAEGVEAFAQKAANSATGIKGTLTVSGSWDGSNQKNEDVYEYHFGEDTFITYPHGIGDAGITKTVVSQFNANTGLVTWKIEVTTTEGTNGNITVTDTLPAGFTLESVRYDLADGTTEPAVAHTVSGQNITFTLPELEHDGTRKNHIIYVTTKCTNASLTSAKNTVTGTYTRFDNKEMPLDAEKTINLITGMLDKNCDGTLGANDWLTWTITVNSSWIDIAGLTLTDNKMAGCSDFTITPLSGYTRSADGSSITFNAVANGVNENKYTITYKTKATQVWQDNKTIEYNGKTYKLYSYDENTAYLKKSDDTVIAQDTETEWFSIDSIGLIDKVAAYDDDTRTITYKITINASRHNVAGIDDLQDYFTDMAEGELPDGFTYKADSVVYKVNDGSNTASSLTSKATIPSLMDSVLAEIKADKANDENYNKYYIEYKIFVDYDATGSATNYAKIVFTNDWTVGDYGNSVSYTGIPMLDKVGNINKNEDRYEWTVTINGGFAAMNGWVVTDEITSENSTLLYDVNNKQTIEQYNSSGTKVGETLELQKTTLDELFVEVTKLTTDGNTNKIVVKYYTDIDYAADVVNTVSLKPGADADEKEQDVEVPFSYNATVTKNGNGYAIESDGTVKLNWTAKADLPSTNDFDMDKQEWVIEDTFSAGQYLTDSDKETLKSALAASFGDNFKEENLEYTVTSDGKNGFKVTFSRVPSDHEEGISETFSYTTHINAADFGTSVSNTFKQTFTGFHSWEATGYIYNNNNVEINKVFNSSVRENGKAYSENLGWTITFTLPVGTPDKSAFDIYDNIPAGVTLTSVQTTRKTSGSGTYDSVAWKPVDGGSYTDGSYHVKYDVNSDGTSVLHVYWTKGGVHVKAGTKITVKVYGKITDPDAYFGNATQADVTNSAYAKVKVNGVDVTSVPVSVTEPVYRKVEATVEKGGGLVNGLINTLEYAVDINTEGRQMLPSAGGKLEAVDTLKWSNAGSNFDASSIQLVAGSVKLYNRNNDGTRGSEYTGEWSYEPGSTSNSYTIELSIPDATPLILVYRYTVTPKTDGTSALTLTNTFKLGGKEYGGSTSETIRPNFIKDSTATAVTDAITFIKHEKGNAVILLPGGKFTLSVYKNGSWNELSTGETNDKGKLIFPAEDKVIYETKTLYKLVEVTAPEHYVLDSTPIFFALGTPASVPSNVTYYKSLNENVQVWLPNEPETTSISVSKEWLDDVTLGNRPESIVVKAYEASDSSYSNPKGQVTLSGPDWSGTISDLRKYDRYGNEIVYTVREEAVTGYSSTVEYSASEGYTIKNTPETTDVAVEKVWRTDSDTVLPEKIDVQLKRDGKVVGSVELNEGNNWKDTFENLPKYYNGKLAVYTVDEVSVPSGYSKVVDGLKIINIELTDIAIQKIWDDFDNLDNTRPESVTLQLKRNNAVYGEPVTLTVDNATDKNTWSYTFKDLPKYATDGTAYTYTVVETETPEGYTKIESGLTVTNKYTPETVEVTGVKSWADGNATELRPASVTIRLLADGVDTGKTATATASGNWAFSFTGLDKFKTVNGVSKEIKYTVVEEAINGWESSVTGTMANGFTITNVPEFTDIPVTKVWLDNLNEPLNRPDSISVSIYYKGESKALDTITLKADDWTGSFTGLRKYNAEGEKIEYEIKEAKVDFYDDPTYEFKDGCFYISNCHTMIEVSVEKVWNDGGIIKHDPITVQLLRNGEAYGEPVDLSDENEWQCTFENLPEYYKKEKARYTVVEVTPDGYSERITGSVAAGYTITNTKLTEVEATKIWEDDYNRDGLRPASITLQLKQNGVNYGDPVTLTAAANATDGKTWKYTFTELPMYDAKGGAYSYTVVETAVPSGYSRTESGMTVTNSYAPDTVDISGVKAWNDNSLTSLRPASITIKLLADGEDTGKTATATASGNWAFSFTGLPKNRNNGSESVAIEYTVEEVAITGWTPAVDNDSYTVTNTPDYTVIPVTKAWNDTNDIDGNRPASIEVSVFYSTDTKFAYPLQTIVLTAEGKWTGEFTGLRKYDSEGRELQYTVREKKTTGYEEGVVTGTNAMLTVTNTPEVTEVSVAKVWNDGGIANHDGVSVQLKRNGENYGTPVTLNATNKWQHTFENLPKYYNKEVAKYTVEETVPAGYTHDINGSAADGFVITNTLLTEITVKKVWDDNGNSDGLRPETITLQLYQNGIYFNEATFEGKGNEWTYTFRNLRKYDAQGNEYKYTVQENNVPSGYSRTVKDLTVTNSYTPGTVSVSGQKNWVDGGVEEGRPESITINLLADGQQYASKTVTANDGWMWSFTELPQYRDGGIAIIYTIEEEAVSGYTTTVNGYNVTNTIEQDTVSVSGVKTWIDPEGTVHPEITIRLWRDGTEIDSITLANGETTYSFDDLPKYAVRGLDGSGIEKYTGVYNGHEFVYTVTEDMVDGYGTVQDGTNFINTIDQEFVEVEGVKTWIDPEDTVHPEITIRLWRDDTEIDSITLADGETAYSFDNLPKYAEDGHVYEYTVTEDEVEGYTTVIDGYAVTNTIVQEYVGIDGVKTWIDPEGTVHPEITIRLWRDDTEIESITLADGETTYSFDNLPKYAVGEIEGYEGLYDGHTFIYTLTEDVVDGYGTVQDGNNFTNRIDQEYIELNGTKTWVDPEDTEHPEIVIRLWRDSVEIAEKRLADGEETYSFAGLEKYAEDGHIYEYTVTEDVVNGYISEQDGCDFTNTIEQDYFDLKGTKTWNAPEDIDYPVIIIRLLRDDVEIAQYWMTSGERVYDFRNLPMYAVGEIKGYDGEYDGHRFVYTVTEDPVPGYTSEINGYDIINTIEQEYVEISGVKTWVDPEGTNHPRITINLLRDGREVDEVVLADGEVTYSFTELEKYAPDGHLYEYTLTEDFVPGYTSEQDGTNFINTIEQGYVSVWGTKTWIAPAGTVHPDITIRLMQDGVEIDSVTLKNGEVDYRFDELDRFAPDGHAYEYTVAEDPVPGYTSVQEGVNFVNTIEQEFVDISGTKTWVDPDGTVHPEITINLLQNGVEIAETKLADGEVEYSFTNLDKYAPDGTLYEYTVTEDPVEGYASSIDGFAITNEIRQDFVSVSGTKTWIDPEGTVHPEITINLLRDGVKIDEIKLANGETSYSFSVLEKFAPDGHTYEYTVTEDAVEGYATAIDGFAVTNTIIQEFVEIEGTKTWIDPEGTIHPEITINLLRDGEEIAEIRLANGQEEYSFTNLAKYAPDGHAYEYTVTEDAVEGYVTTQDGADFINTVEQDLVDIEGVKTWVDPEGTVHPTITIRLLRDGVEIDMIELADGEVEYSFIGLDKYAEDGHEYEYALVEDVVPGYTSALEGYNFTNTMEQTWISVTVNKVWMDNGYEGLEHPTIEIQLLRNGAVYQTVQLANGVTSHTFRNLPKYNLRTGANYVYTVAETPVEGYETTIDGLTIINTATGPEMISISGTKTWVDDGREHDNAAEIKLVLTRSIEGGASEVVTDADFYWDGNTYYFRNLRKADDEGNLYQYTVTEDPVEGYDVVYEGYNITNILRYDVLPIEISGTKYWNDNDDAAGLRPETVTIQLMRDGELIQTVVIDAEDNWTYAFTDLPDNDGYGHYYTYTVTEQLVANYWLRMDGYDLYNTFIPEEPPTVGKFRHYREEELEELLTIFDYGVPLWGGLLGTGDEIPVYPFVFAGLGMAALIAFIVLNRKRRKA